MSAAELATSYAALILADEGLDITSDKLQTLLQAAQVSNVEPIWTSLFAKALDGKDVKSLLLNIGSGSGAAGPASASTAAAATDAGAAADPGSGKGADSKKKQEEEKEESDEDMGFSLFD